MLTHRRFILVVLWPFLFSVLIAVGCGKKTDPVPQRMMPPPAIMDFRAESLPEGIMLMWSAKEKDGRITQFQILRGEEFSDRACAGCPHEYRPLTTLKADDRTWGADGFGSYRFLDSAVVENRFYTYRITACSSGGNCGSLSAPVHQLR